MNHIPDKYEHLVRYYGYYSNRSRGARRLIENGDDTAGSIRIDDVDVVERILKHLKVWDPQPDTRMQRPFSTHSTSTTR